MTSGEGLRLSSPGSLADTLTGGLDLFSGVRFDARVWFKT
jgi:hypothetical protein